MAAAEASAVAAVAAAVGTLLAARVAVVVASAEVVASMPRVFGVVFFLSACRHMYIGGGLW